MVDKNKLRVLINQLYSTVNELEVMFPGRHFTPDGHLVGSLGECIVAETYGLELMPASNKGYDAVTRTGVKVEIKATQSESVAFRSEPQHTIIIKLFRDGTFEEIYNGPGAQVWGQFKDKPRPGNGQFQISLNKLKQLNQAVDSSDRVPRVSS